MNLYGIRAIYRFEMARTFRTIAQSIAALCCPLRCISLYLAPP